MCISYLELNQLKDFAHMSNNRRLLFNILDHICTTCLFLQILEKSFQILLQIAKGIGI
jgi:hypothetical protein